MKKLLNFKTLFPLFLTCLTLATSLYADVNIAPLGTATQSTTGYGGIASKAIDGNTNGNDVGGSVSHTLYPTYYEWLLIDLGAIYHISKIEIFNRTDCCQDRLKSTHVMLSTINPNPTSTLFSLNTSFINATWKNKTSIFTTPPDVTTFTLPSPATYGRYLLIQKELIVSLDPTIQRLSLAEVQIWTPDAISSTCPGNILPNIDETSIDATDNYPNVTLPPNTTYYYSFTAAVSGTIQTNSYSNKLANSLYINNGCGGSTLWQDTNNSNNKSSPNVLVSAGQQIVIAFERRYNDDINLNINLNIDFTFIASNDIPIANAGTDQSVNIGNTVTLDGSGSSDNDGNIVSYLWTEGATTLANTFAFSKSDFSTGVHTLTLTVTDNLGATDTDSVIITINTAPVAHAGTNLSAVPNANVQLDASLSSDDVGITDYSWYENGTLIATGVNPIVSFASAGVHTLTLTVKDINGLEDTDTVVVTINTSPVAKDINLSMLVNTSITFSLLATDADDDNISSFPIQSGPTHGVLSGPDTNLTYTPDANFTGLDIFTYQAYDGIAFSNDATVRIEVFPLALAVDDDYNTTYLTLLTGNVMDNDLGNNIRLLETNITTSNGNLNISNDGNFTYNPHDRFDGNDSFTYTIIDDRNITSTATVNILVYPPRNDMSIIKTAPASVDAGLSMDYVLNISSLAGEAYLDAKNVRVTDTLPSGVTFNGVDASEEWTCAFISPTLTCDATTIAPEYNGSIVVHVFAPHTLGSIINTARVGSDTIDINTSNNISTATTTVNAPDVDMSITKTASVSTVSTTTAYSYTLTIQNLGSAGANSIKVTDVLDSNLLFININSGTDWICNQGSDIICDYVANGNIFPAGGSSSIVIDVRSPSTAMNISNTAEVTTSTIEHDTTNNTSSVNVNVTQGTNQFNDVNLTKYLQYNINGDFKIIGNANINFPGTTTPTDLYNDTINMTYVDTDSTANTFNSSSSTLNLDNNLTILWAGLYWEGHICDQNIDGDTAGCSWISSPYANYNGAMANPTNSIGSIRLKTPLNDYQTITADTLNVIVSTVNGATINELTYSAFAEVTELVKAAGEGSYSVANLILTEGIIDQGGNYGGWLLLTIYEDPTKTLAYKNISVFNGFQYIQADNTPLDITGFLTPHSGDINGSIAFFAADGDPAIGGVARMRDKKTLNFIPLSNTVNPGNNLFNSTMTEFGNNINTGVTRTYGVDADRIDISNFMTNNQTDTSFRFDVTNGTEQDYYTLSMFTFATDLTTPIIDEFEKSATIIRKNGQRIQAEPNVFIYPGDQIEYSLIFTNTGDEEAIAVEIFDDFDYDGLSNVLDVDHFDASKLKLYKGSGTTVQVTNPNCGYNVHQRRVYCKIASIDKDETYRMDFTLTVKDYITPYIGTEANNTAYAKYKNPNGNDYIVRYTTPEAVGGKSNGLNAGTFSTYTDDNQTYISVEAINEFFDYENNTHITTKIVNSPFNIKLILIDANSTNVPYQAWLDKASQYKPMPVIITLQETNSTTPNKPLNNPATNFFNHGNENIMTNGLTLSKAHKSKNLKMAYLDWKKILGSVSPSSSCVTNVNESPNLNGMPACFNDTNYVQDVFPTLAFPNVALCFGNGTGINTIPAGRLAACNPLAYDTRGDPVSDNRIFPSAYNHSYGCYQCVTQGLPNFKHTSSDNFAARPDSFVLSSNELSFPDLLRSGQDYNISIRANDAKGNPTQDYNTSTHILREGELTRYLKNDTVALSTEMQGDFNISTTSDFNISNGISHRLGNTPNSVPEDVLGVTFSDVGKVGMQIIDPNWAIADTDDPNDTPNDCNSTTINNISIEASAYICGDINATFIPHHFDVKNVKIHNHRDGGFTYLSDDLNMSAHISVTIEAKNAGGSTTKNFNNTPNLYEHPVTVDLNVTEWNATLSGISSRHHLNNNHIIKDISTEETLAFTSGRKTIEQNNSKLMFNYTRDINEMINPFDINGSDINITVNALYTDLSDVNNTANIKGSNIGMGKATFYYARAKPRESYYPNVDTMRVRTPIDIMLYCDLGYTPCVDTFNLNSTAYSSGQKLWLSIGHDKNLSDGNITLTSPTTLISGGGTTNGARVTRDLNISSGTEDNVFVTRFNSEGLTMLVHIRLDTTSNTTTSNWLIYNEDDDIVDPNPFFAVEFIGSSGSVADSNWTGHGKTGHVVGSDASKKSNRRLGW